MRHDRIQTVISGANPISLKEAACERDPWPRRVRHVRAAGKTKWRFGPRYALRRLATLRCAGRMARPEMRIAVRFKKSDSKNPRPVSRRGLRYSCDDEDMPVICPTCQIFWNDRRSSPTRLFKSLNRRRGFLRGNRFRSFDNRRWSHSGGSLLLVCRLLGRGLRDSTGLRGISSTGSRSGSPNSPRMRDRGTCGISNERACHRAHRSQNDRARQRAQSGTSGTLLRSCFERKK